MLGSEDDVWIGFNDVNWEMRFLWTDGKGVSYTNWAKGQPSSLPDGSSRMYGYFDSEAGIPDTILLAKVSIKITTIIVTIEFHQKHKI